MNKNSAYYVGTHQYSYRSGEIAEIIGVVTHYPEDGKDPRACYMVKYADGKIDYCPTSDYENYRIIPATEGRESFIAL